MNIIEEVKSLINRAPNIHDFSSGLYIDYTEQTPGNFGLFSNGETVLKKFINGTELHQHNFVLYATNQAYNDYDRLNNSSFLLDLTNYLHGLRNIETDNGTIEKITCANGMVFSVPSGDFESGCTYQLQINAIYHTHNENTPTIPIEDPGVPQIEITF